MLRINGSAKIISFPSERVEKGTVQPFENGHCAQILFFLGVRYERYAAEDVTVFCIDDTSHQESWFTDAPLHNQSA